MNFGTLINRVRTWRGTQSGNESTEGLTYIKETINSVYKELLSQEDLAPNVKESVMELNAPYDDGTLTVTVGVNLASLSTIASDKVGFTKAHIGGKLHIGNTGMYYDVVAVDTLTAYLDRPYQGSTDDDVAFSLYRDTLPLPSDFRKMENVRMGDSNGYSLISRGSNRFDKVHPNSMVSTPSGDPEEYTIWKRTDSAWFTGLCTFTAGTTTVAFAELPSAYGVENWRYRCIQSADGVRYRVKRADLSDLTAPLILELDRPYGGTSAVGTVASVDPKGTWQLQVWPPPTSSDSLVFKYIGSDYDMVNDADEPILHIDYHDAIWKGAIYYMAQLDGEHPAEMVDRLWRDWQEAKIRMENYRTADRDTTIRRRSWGGSKWYSAFNIPYTVTGYSG